MADGLRFFCERIILDGCCCEASKTAKAFLLVVVEQEEEDSSLELLDAFLVSSRGRFLLLVQDDDMIRVLSEQRGFQNL